MIDTPVKPNLKSGWEAGVRFGCGCLPSSPECEHENLTETHE